MKARLGKYRLDGKLVIYEPSLEKWAEWFEKADRRIARDERGGVVVSTVFLGLDYNFSDIGPPIVFETMVFGGPLHQYQDRCASYDQAMRMHAEVCERAFADNITELRAASDN